METVKGRSGAVLRVRGASPSHHEIRDTWTEQRGKFHRDSQSAVVLLSRRSRTHYTVPPSVRVLTSRTRAPTGRRKERIPSAFQSIRLCPSVPPFGRPRPRIPSFERTVRPSVRVRPLFLLARGRGVCGMPQGRPLSRVPTDSQSASRESAAAANCGVWAR